MTLEEALFTVSLGNGFGSKGKQHHKHTPSETQSHTQGSHKMHRRNMEYFQSSSGKAKIPACPQLTFVNLALHGNEVLSVTTESVNLDLEMR